MSAPATPRRIFDLLPAVYRMRDNDQTKALEAFLAVVEKQFYAIQNDIQGLFENWFIETCDEWVVPYIGDLLGVQGLNAITSSEFSARPYVANTLSYRRRKGTITVLEKLSRDITGWPAKAVEFFQLLQSTQNINHLRLFNFRTPDLRESGSLELLNGPFEQPAHTVDVRSLTNEHGKYNIQNIGIFLWRLQSYPLLGAMPWPVATPSDGRYTFNALGFDAPLFNSPEMETQSAHRVGERDVPGPLRRRALYDDLSALRRAVTSRLTPSSLYFGSNPVLALLVASKAVDPQNIFVCDLSQWSATTAASFAKNQAAVNPAAGPVVAAVDPKLGRLLIAAVPGSAAPTTPIQVNYSYGFSGDLGGGPYDRRQSRPGPGDPPPSTPDTVADPSVLGGSVFHVSTSGSAVATVSQAISLALAALDSTKPEKSKAVIQIDDSRTYSENLSISLAPGTTLFLQAANKQRPVILGDLNLQGASAPTGTAKAPELKLDGLVIAGHLTVQQSLGHLTLRHCTVVPGWSLQNGEPVKSDAPSLSVAVTGELPLALNLDHTICGPLLLPANMGTLTLQDSIIDSPFGAGLSTLTPALVSGSLPTPLALNSPQLSFYISIAGEGPHLVSLSPPAPTTIADAGAALEAAITAASDSDAFSNARVVVAGSRLVILPGAPGNVLITPATLDSTVADLLLDSKDSLAVTALISRPVPYFPQLTSASPSLSVTMSQGRTFTFQFSLPTNSSIADLAAAMQTAIRAITATPAPGPAFSGAIVIPLDDRLLILPGASEVLPIFAASASDPTTFRQLGLELDRFAIAADEIGQQPGPPTSISRSTIFGPCHVQSLMLASDAIFTASIVTDRRQVGCVRFSYVLPGSEVPRRYRCQPDLSLTDISDRVQRQAIKSRLVPSFVSTTYGDPGYAQLGSHAAEEILVGADGGNEMGAFNFLKNAQRQANLNAAVEEYLRFGLEAGFFFAT